MIAERQTLAAEALMPKILALLEVSDAVPLVVTGNSMVPFLKDQRDTVYLSKPVQPLKRGDIIFYQRDNGQYILHRICKIKDGRYFLVGDAQHGVEPNIRPDQIIALVNAVRRKGKLIKPGDIAWEFYEHFWIHTVSVRPAIFKIYSIFH